MGRSKINETDDDGKHKNTGNPCWEESGSCNPCRTIDRMTERTSDRATARSVHTGCLPLMGWRGIAKRIHIQNRTNHYRIVVATDFAGYNRL